MKHLNIFSLPWFVLSIYPDRLNFLNNIFSVNSLKIPTPFTGFQMTNLNGFENNTLGHVAIIRMAKSLNFPGIVVFEDDTYPCKDIKQKLSSINEIPNDLECLILGWIQNNNVKSDKFNHIHGVPLYGTHSYLLLESGYDRFLNFFSTTRKNADWIFCSRINQFYFYNECLFIQYNFGQSVGNQQKYRYEDGLGHNFPPKNFKSIEQHYEDSTFQYIQR